MYVVCVILLRRSDVIVSSLVFLADTSSVLAGHTPRILIMFRFVRALLVSVADGDRCS